MIKTENKMKKATIVTTIAIVVLAIGAIFAIAQRAGGEGRRGPGGFGKGGHERGGMMFRGLDLTDEQKTQVKSIMDASREKLQPVHEAMKANHEKLADLTKNGAFDEAQVTEIANAQGALHAQMIVERQRTQAQVFQLLTDEQKAKAAEMKGKMKEGFGGGRRGGHGRMGGGEAPEGAGL